MVSFDLINNILTINVHKSENIEDDLCTDWHVMAPD